MPPRIPTVLQAELSSLTSSSSSSSITNSASPLERALLSFQSSTFPSSRRSFSATAGRAQNVPVSKQRYLQWMKTRGRALEHHTPGRPNYISHEGSNMQPFPSNPAFLSQPVLSEEAREMIHRRVAELDEPIKVVSADLGVDIRRVAAVVRMKEIEKDWIAQGKPLAKPYSKALMEMLPTHDFPENSARIEFEPINDLHVHGYTMQQLFVPVSESRHFTRQDAAKAFHEKMLSADERTAHKELVEHHRRVKQAGTAAGGQAGGASRMTERDSHALFVQEARASEQALVAAQAQAKEREKRVTKLVTTDRFEFRIKKMEVDDVGRDGRARKAVGWRYGTPHQDRKKNQVKIPTKIE